MQSFFTLLYGIGGRGMGKNICPEGALEKWLQENQIANTFLSEEVFHLMLTGSYSFIDFSPY